MRAVHRYIIEPGESTIELPYGCSTLQVAWSQMYDCASLWVEVDTEASMSTFRYATVATGSRIPDSMLYAGSLETPDGLVFHLYIDPTEIL